MRKWMYCLVFVAALSWLTAGLVLARNGQQGSGGGSARMLAELKAKLNLTDDQTSKVQTMLETFHQQNQGHRPSADAVQQLDQQIMTVLTPDQQAKFKQLLEERAQHHPGNGASSPPSH